MTMIDEKLDRLTAALLDKTRAGKVTWEPTASENVYLANFSKYAVSISRVSNTAVKFSPTTAPTGVLELGDYTTFHYVLSLLNEDGEDIEIKTERIAGHGDYNKLEHIFNLARRSAYNFEEGLDTILQALEAE